VGRSTHPDPNWGSQSDTAKSFCHNSTTFSKLGKVSVGIADLSASFFVVEILLTFNLNENAMLMKQTSFSSAEFSAKKSITRREKFLTDMGQVMP
jgi:hypothetical protein